VTTPLAVRTGFSSGTLTGVSESERQVNAGMGTSGSSSAGASALQRNFGK
jgi:hypothetical protein